MITNICGLSGNSCNGSTYPNSNGISFPINWKNVQNGSCHTLNSSYLMTCSSNSQCPSGVCNDPWGNKYCVSYGDPCGGYCQASGGGAFCDSPLAFSHSGKVDVYGSKTDAGTDDFSKQHCQNDSSGCGPRIFPLTSAATVYVSSSGTVIVRDWNNYNNILFQDSGYCRVQLDVYDDVMGGSPTDFIVWRDPSLCSSNPTPTPTATPPPNPYYTATAPIGGITIGGLYPTFTWDGDTTGITYNSICIGTSINGPCPYSPGVSDRSYTPAQPLTGDTTYYWQIYGVRPGGGGPCPGGSFCSAWVSFKTPISNQPPNTPTLVAPPDNQWINYLPTFTATVTDPNAGDTLFAKFDLDSDGGVDGNGSIVATGSNSTWTPATLPDTSGRYWRAYAQDNSGATSGWSGSWLLLKDTVAPTISLSVYPTSWTNGNPTWSWSASDDRSGLRLTNRYLYYLYKFSDTGNVLQNQSYTDNAFLTPVLSEGSYFLQVCAYDNAGNTGCSGNVMAYVDKTAPTVSLSVVPTSWTNGNPTWSWSSADTGGSDLKSSSRYRYFLDDADQGTTDNTTLTPTTLLDGSHNLKVCAYDNAGNLGCSGNVMAYVDKTGPVVNLTVTPTSWTNLNPTWSWTATDALSGLRASNTYIIYLDGVDTGINRNLGDTLTYTPTSLGDGVHKVRVCAFDAAVGTPLSNEGCSVEVLAYVDKTPPTAALTVVPSGWTNTNPTWSWTGTDAVSGIRDSNAYLIYLDGVSTGSWKNRNDQLSYITNLTDGTHYLQIYAYDNAGNVGYSDVVYTYIDRVPPTVTLDEDHVANDSAHTSPHWFWVAADSSSGLRATNTYYVECNFTCSGGSYNFFTNSTEFHPNLQVGSYSIQVTAYDQANNSATTLWKPVTIINVNAPAAPTLIAPPNGVWINYNPAFTATAIDPRNLQIKVLYDLDTDNSVDGEGQFANSGGQSIWIPTSISDTSGRLWRAKAQDINGDESGWSAPWTLMKDTVSPVVPLSVSPASWTNTDPTWSWVGATDGRSGIRLTNTYRNTLDSTDLGFTQATTYTTSTLTDGLHPFQACVYDNAGNLGCSAPVNAFIDKTQPLINLNEDHTTLDSYHASPHWYWTASDKGGSNLRTTNTYFVECNWTCSPPLSSFWTTSLEYHPTLPNGTFSLRVTAFDAAGNSGISGSKQVTVIACTIPDLPVPDSGTGCTNSNPSWSWTAPTGGAKIVNYDVQRSWAVDNVQQAATTYTSALSPGVYWIKVRAQNSCGNWGEFSPPVQMTVDRTPPDTPAGACNLTTKPTGQSCTSNGQCGSGNCANGVCCNTACTGNTCQRCDSYSSAGAGTCGYVSTQVDPDNECTAAYNACFGNNRIGPNGSCSGTGFSCNTGGLSDTCATAGACQTGGGCSGGSCVPVTNVSTLNGPSCAGTCDAYCSSGSCINTDSPAGTCTVATNARVASGGTGHCASGSCVSDTSANGQSCTTGSQCTSGNCVGGTCCNTAVCSTAGTCQTGGGCSTGTCIAVSNVPAGQDPNSQCTSSYNACSGNNKVGPDGNCDGSGACNTTGLSTACPTAGTCQTGGGCSEGSCVAVGYTAANTQGTNCTAAHYRCNGSGTCVVAPTYASCTYAYPNNGGTTCNTVCANNFGSNNAGCINVWWGPPYDYSCTYHASDWSCGTFGYGGVDCNCSVYSY